MKRLICAVVFAAVLVGWVRLVADLACYTTPIKPIVPIGCVDLVAQCVVDKTGRGHWVWVCVKEE